MSSAGARLHAAADPRGTRLRAEADGRRERVMAAARSAFFELGLEGASLREIAKRAGYTPGALYSYFPSKEAVYGALLGESLERLNLGVQAAARTPLPQPGADNRARLLCERVRIGALAFFDFYLDSPGDLALGFYLFHGLRPRGLTPELNRALNARLLDALAPIRQALLALGLARERAQTELTALFAHAVGLLLLSHTGRIRMFDRHARTLFDHYLQALVQRTAAKRGGGK